MAYLKTILEPEKAEKIMKEIAEKLGFDDSKIVFLKEEGKRKKYYKFRILLKYKKPKEKKKFVMLRSDGAPSKAICEHGYMKFYFEYCKHDPESSLYNPTTLLSLQKCKVKYRIGGIKSEHCNCPEEEREVIKNED